MSVCPITYQPIGAGEKYSKEGLHLLSPKLISLNDLPYSAEEQRREAVARATKMSIQGVQPKLSAKLDVSNQSFVVVDNGGEYILKPQNDSYPELPQNEDLTMRLGRIAGIEIPLHGLIYSKDGSLTYFIKRFDRIGKKKKIAVEDFAQLSGKSRDTKYDSSMEKVITVLDTFCTFPAIEKVKLFRLTLFNFLVGNEDMHLKNFSLIRRDSKIELTPAYDLLNTTIVLRGDVEEIALPIDGRKKNLTQQLFLKYFGSERLKLSQKVIEETLQIFQNSFIEWQRMIAISFLSNPFKEKYKELMSRRRKILGV